MNKYRIEIQTHRPATAGAPTTRSTSVFEGYYNTTNDAITGALQSIPPTSALCDEEQEINVRTLKTKLFRSATGCKRVQ